MLRLEMLPACHGDALLLEYGPADTVTHRTLIDAGPGNAYKDIRQRLLEIPAHKGKRQLELLVITHVDADHIEGVVKLLQDDDVAIDPGDVWFNDWNHLAPLVKKESAPKLGPEQGEFLGALLVDQKRPWNNAFKGDTVMVPQDPEAKLQSYTTPGGLSLTVVSPTIDTLLALRKTWKKAIEAAGFRPGNRDAALREFAKRRWAQQPKALGDESSAASLDHAEANGSSIGLIAEYRGVRLLLTGDAYAPVLRESLQRWQRQSAPKSRSQERIAFDAFKLPHHGSGNNITPQLLEVLSTPTYLVSTNGAKFHHPDREALQLVIAGHHGPDEPVLRFNYRSPYTKAWAKAPACEARYEDEAVLLLDTK